jgi:hypothetical protein
LGVDNHGGIAAQAQPQPTPASQSPGLPAQTARPENKAACSKLPAPNASRTNSIIGCMACTMPRVRWTQAGMPDQD